MMKRCFLLLGAGLLSLSVSASDLAGMWKHDDEPVWVEISFDGDTASGTVLRNDNKPDAVGAVFLKNVQGEDGVTGPWKGQVYAQALEEFKDAEISLQAADAMKIKVKLGFISRSVTWSRIESVPAQ